MMNNQQIEDIDDEISILEIVEFFIESWKRILFGGVVGGALGVSFVLLSPAMYQATANIQLGKVAGVDVEPPNVVLEKLKMPTYFSAQTLVACGVEEPADPGTQIIKALNPTALKGTPIIKISYKDKNIDQAKKCLESSLNDIRTNQNGIAEPIIRQKKSQIAKLRQELEAARQVSEALSTKTKTIDFSDAKAASSFILLRNALDKKNEFMNLNLKIADLELELVEPNTKEAYFATPIFAENTNGEQKKFLITLGSIIGGVVLTLGFLIVGRWWAKIKASVIPPQVSGGLK
jgi:hypothetical protein